jgi:hypothetical protein
VLVWLGVLVVLWLGVVVDVPVCDPVDDPGIEGFVVVTAPALPVVPAVPVAEGVVWVAEGVLSVAEGVD